MNYKLEKNKILVSKEDFNPTHILECGQVFCYRKEGEEYIVSPQNQLAKICEKKDCYEIITTNPQYFVTFFDLNKDYSLIKRKLSAFDILKKPLKFGYGIRILKQDLFETMVSFIVSANNNIKRIQLILSRLRDSIGGGAFPTYETLLKQNEKFFTEIGAGYRAKYLYTMLRQITPKTLEEWRTLPTPQLRKNLCSICGVGPKVADCILLFGYGRGDVFPVDTWIHQMYNKYYPPLNNREQIRYNLVSQFGDLAGYAQQYLFYYQRLAKEEF